jgi:hypothetical protein
MEAQLRRFLNDIIHGARFQKGLAEGDLYGGGWGLRKGPFQGDQHLPTTSRFYDGSKTGPFAIHKDESVSAAHSQNPGHMLGLRPSDRAKSILSFYFLNKKASHGQTPL